MTALDLLRQDEERSIRAAGRAALERRSYDLSSLKSPSPSLLEAFGSTTASGATVTESTAFNVSAVGACVNVLAQSIAMLPLKVYRRTAAGADEETSHPLSHLLKRKPGVTQTSYQWRSWMQTCLGLGGNAYARIYRDTNFDVVRIEPLKSSDIEVLYSASSGRLSYRWKNEVILQDFEVIHVRGLSTDGFVGRSPLSDLRESVGLSLTAQQFAASTFANGNRKPGVFEGGPGITREKALEFKKMWDENYAGAARGGKNPVLLGGFTWKESGFSNEDAELLMTRKFEVEEIARAYRVPLTLLQSMEKSTSFGTGIAELSRGFVNFTLNPWLCNWEQELEDKLLTEEEKTSETGLFIKFNLDALLRGSPLEQAQKAEIERRSRLITANEYRRQKDMNELPDTGANSADWPLNAQESGQTSEPQRSAA